MCLDYVQSNIELINLSLSLQADFPEHFMKSKLTHDSFKNLAEVLSKDDLPLSSKLKALKQAMCCEGVAVNDTPHFKMWPRLKH